MLALGETRRRVYENLYFSPNFPVRLTLFNNNNKKQLIGSAPRHSAVENELSLKDGNVIQGQIISINNVLIKISRL